MCALWVQGFALWASGVLPGDLVHLPYHLQWAGYEFLYPMVQHCHCRGKRVPCGVCYDALFNEQDREGEYH